MLDRLRTSRWLLPLLLTAVAAVTLFTRLGEPARIIFDEVYYVGDARNYLELAVEDSFAVHPPVGKWLIAIGIAIFGDEPFGWRFAGAVAGTATVLLTYLLGLRLLRDRGYAALAALLLLTDGLFFVQARTAMLDIFLAFFVALAAWALLVDAESSGPAGAAHTRPTTADDPDDPDTVADRERPRFRVRPHPWRAVAGIAFGLAIATKWSGVLALVAGGLLVVGWELAARRGVTGRALTRLGPLLGSVLVTLALVPAAVYAVSYVPWLANIDAVSPGSDCAPGDPASVTLPQRVGVLVCFHNEVLEFHSGLEAEHPYRAPAYTWPVLARPVVYYWETCKGDRAAGMPTENDEGELVQPDPCVVEEHQAGEVLAVGNPALWWLFIPVAVLLLAGAAARDRRAWFLVTFWAVQFAPWLVPPMGSRPVFFFYMTPVVAFLALSVTYACAWIGERRPVLVPFLAAGSGAALGFAGATVAGADGVAPWLWASGLYALGAVVGGVWSARSPRTSIHEAASPTGRVVAGVVAVLAVAAFLYFYPVWTGLPLDEAAIRRRWWIQPGWI